MEKRAIDEELDHPFAVMWGHEGKYECFAKLIEAFDFVDKYKSKTPIWLMEIGTYSTDRGKPIRDWIYWWWNEKADWGTPPAQAPSAKSGYPYRAPNRIVDYQPFQIEQS